VVSDHAVVVACRGICEALRQGTVSDPATGKHRYAIVQAEDELASIGMVIGAGWNGARAFTATAGPAFR
jgi:pyruvate/2-oxoacid:ferredoxin oxidoreductase alpha subunit